MTASDIRKKFLQFFEARNHTIIPSASLVPEHDPSVLFTTAGMHPLIPYLMGQPHPGGKRLANIQKCMRTDDIDDVGDFSHLTFFEMLGNWSLGDYWKEESLHWSFAFLTEPRWLGLPKDRLYAAVFAGDKGTPRDEESIAIWKKIFKRSGIDAEIGKRIVLYGREENWWGPVGATGPCGPDSEIFFDTLGDRELGTHAEGFHRDEACHLNCACGRYVELWNNVFMEYEKKANGSYVQLQQKNVDTGMGLERIAMIMQEKRFVFESDLFTPIVAAIHHRAQRDEPSSVRVVADHLRAATFLMSDGVAPSNTERGYVVRRLIRRAIRHGRLLGIDGAFTTDIADVVITTYGETYREVPRESSAIQSMLEREEKKFSKTLARGVTKLRDTVEALGGATELPAAVAFDLYQSYGFPFEMTAEELTRINPELFVDKGAFDHLMKKHQETSRRGAAKRFAGGLADHGAIATKYHTATHLLHQALRDVLGPHVLQKGSNITDKRLRFDFSHERKMTEEEIKSVERVVNEKIKQDLPVRRQQMTVDEAQRLGALGVFPGRYDETVYVYTIGDYSKEICGGPHVKRTGEIGGIKIVKEEAVASGIRRLRAVLV